MLYFINPETIKCIVETEHPTIVREVMTALGYIEVDESTFKTYPLREEVLCM